MALTALLAVMLGVLLQGWLQARDHLQSRPVSGEQQVLAFCSLLDLRFEGLSLRLLHEQGRPLRPAALDWQPAQQRLEWLSNSAQPLLDGQPLSRISRQALHWQADQQRLVLLESGDLDSPGLPRWRLLTSLHPVQRLSWQFHHGQRWLAYPAADVGQRASGVRVQFDLDGVPYVCSFALPAAS